MALSGAALSLNPQQASKDGSRKRGGGKGGSLGQMASVPLDYPSTSRSTAAPPLGTIKLAATHRAVQGGLQASTGAGAHCKVWLLPLRVPLACRLNAAGGVSRGAINAAATPSAKA